LSSRRRSKIGKLIRGMNPKIKRGVSSVLTRIIDLDKKQENFRFNTDNHLSLNFTKKDFSKDNYLLTLSLNSYLVQPLLLPKSSLSSHVSHTKLLKFSLPTPNK
jgi:hypothetical protein